MARLGAAIVAALVALLLALAAQLAQRRAAAVDPRPRPADGEASAWAARLAAAVERANARDLETLGMLIRERTVADDGAEAEAGANLGDEARAALLRCHAILAERFPLAHAAMRVDAINDYSLLYEWEGTDDGLEPVVLVAHLDVVPVSAEQASQWSQPPFGGVVEAGEVWGRGALDVKGRVVSHLAAVEALLAAGTAAPRRTVYLAYGHDEEVGGYEGAASIAAELERRLGGRRVAALLDEGGAVTKGAIPGMGSLEVALVGTAEKGYVCISLKAESKGGHAAWPPLGGTPVTAVSRALAAVHAKQPAPRLTQPVAGMLERASALVAEPYRTIFANLHVFGALLARVFGWKGEKANALVRTTQAVTRFTAGEKNNVVPASAEATINLRLLSGDTVEGTLGRVRAIAEEFGVSAEIDEKAFRSEPSPVSPAGKGACARARVRVHVWVRAWVRAVGAL